MNFRSYQHLVLVGRLGRDARVSQTKSGVEMLSFSVVATKTATVRSNNEQVGTTVCFLARAVPNSLP